MSNIRSLLRAELSTRRVTHPHASYTNTKSNLLSCTVCHLVIKSESLWEGHLRSANHRRNVQKLSELDLGSATNGGGSRKRKADEVDVGGRDGESDLATTSGGRKRKAADDIVDQADGGDGEGRKKTKGQSGQSPPSRAMSDFVSASTESAQIVSESENVAMANAQSAPPDAAITNAPPLAIATTEDPPQAPPQINESEWAAFEADIAPLTHPQIPPKPTPNTAATTIITAAPLSASELSAQRAAAEEAERKKKGRISREEEAEAEREDEGRRMEEEFEVQEEMEGRVRRLRERREMLRRGVLWVDGGRGEGLAGVEKMKDGDAQVRDVDEAEADADADADAGEDGEAEARAGDTKHRGEGATPSQAKEEEEEEEEEDEDDSDDSDEFDEWGLR